MTDAGWAYLWLIFLAFIVNNFVWVGVFVQHATK